MNPFQEYLVEMVAWYFRHDCWFGHHRWSWLLVSWRVWPCFSRRVWSCCPLIRDRSCVWRARYQLYVCPGTSHSKWAALKAHSPWTLYSCCGCCCFFALITTMPQRAFELIFYGGFWFVCFVLLCFLIKHSLNPPFVSGMVIYFSSKDVMKMLSQQNCTSYSYCFRSITSLSFGLLKFSLSLILIQYSSKESKIGYHLFICSFSGFSFSEVE